MAELTDGTEFDGDPLARVSSRTPPTKARWSELELWAAGEGYLLEVRGHSAIPGEVTFAKVHVCESAEAVVETLTSPRGGLTELAWDLLDEAADNDPAFVDPRLGLWVEA